MLTILFGEKKEQTQKFLKGGERIPVTEVFVPVLSIVKVKTLEKDGYNALQVTVGSPRIMREIRLKKDEEQIPKSGSVLTSSDVFKPGDIVDVTGISKGKGFAGVVKRHHFKGGPRTHGQSDRERAPGSIGQTTTPGRVYRGKRMAGKMGNQKATSKNLQVVDIVENKLLIKGLVPGAKNSIVKIKKVGESKKFLPLHTEGDTNAKN